MATAKELKEEFDKLSDEEKTAFMRSVMPSFCRGFGKGPEKMSQMMPETMSEMMSQMKPEMMSQMKPEMMSQMKPEMMSQMKPEMMSQMKPEMMSQMAPWCRDMCRKGGFGVKSCSMDMQGMMRMMSAGGANKA